MKDWLVPFGLAVVVTTIVIVGCAHEAAKRGALQVHSHPLTEQR